ncbi:hypothetical protein C8A00DRAFT_17353 [Chaetomidium leptoderma]|uniref:Uncharacterized protein n=1 Tax=Chaetomidium leptoderma TaxID=669021 RepID=A0AAN6ZTE6_9PEZI|nr:hypothetical protein C8A00DRAFT_17353 [Chaetomidium leptoderma]
MLARYVYDTSSIQDSLLQPKQESAVDRVARLMTSVNAAAAVLSPPTPNVEPSSRL